MTLSEPRPRSIPKETPNKTIVAVIPAYNEERFIASVVLKTKQYVDHVIVVDDGSTDATAELASMVGAEVIRQPKNQGKAEALNTGFEAAQRHHPQAIVCLDGDAQHEPSDIADVVGPILSGEADVVIGSRFLEVKSRIPKWRQVGQHSLTRVTNVLSGTKVSDSQSGFRAFSPSAAKALKFHTQGLSVESEMQFLFEPSQLRVSEVPIQVMYKDGNKRNPIVHGLHVLDAILSLVARRRPLMFFTLTGVVISLLGLLLGARITYIFRTRGDLLLGSTVLTTLLIVVGLLLSMTGIMLHSVGKFVERVRQDTLEIVSKELKDKFGKNF